jgi:hypothetical protein
MEQEQMYYVVGMGNLPGSDELAGYYYLSGPYGYGLQAFRTKEGAEAYIERLRKNPKSRMAQLASVGVNHEALKTALSSREFRVRLLSREELHELMVQINAVFLLWRP